MRSGERSCSSPGATLTCTGASLTEPVSDGADLGVIFMQNVDYSPHCGHGTIALATAAVELGWVERTSPETRVGIDVPAGFIEAFVEWDGTHVAGVRFVNVPSFIWKQDVSIDTPSFGAVTGDIAYGGAFYFYTDGSPFGLAINEQTCRPAERLRDGSKGRSEREVRGRPPGTT